MYLVARFARRPSSLLDMRLSRPHGTLTHSPENFDGISMPKGQTTASRGGGFKIYGVKRRGVKGRIFEDEKELLEQANTIC